MVSELFDPIMMRSTNSRNEELESNLGSIKESQQSMQRILVKIEQEIMKIRKNLGLKPNPNPELSLDPYSDLFLNRNPNSDTYLDSDPKMNPKCVPDLNPKLDSNFDLGTTMDEEVIEEEDGSTDTSFNSAI